MNKKNIVRRSNYFQFICVILLSFYSLNGNGQVSYDSSWQLVNEENGIEVSTRTGAYTAVKEIRISFTLTTTMEHIVDFLSDVPLYADWVYKCDSSLLLKNINPNEFYYYIILDFPFPFEDRDLVVHSKHWVDPVTGVYHSYSTTSTELSYSNNKYVHIDEFESTWNITPKPDGNLLIDYITLSNPGGNIPIWLVNLAITKGPLETMKSFVRMVEFEKKRK